MFTFVPERKEKFTLYQEQCARKTAGEDVIISNGKAISCTVFFHRRMPAGSMVTHNP